MVQPRCRLSPPPLALHGQPGGVIPKRWVLWLAFPLERPKPRAAGVAVVQGDAPDVAERPGAAARQAVATVVHAPGGLAVGQAVQEKARGEIRGGGIVIQGVANRLPVFVLDALIAERDGGAHQAALQDAPAHPGLETTDAHFLVFAGTHRLDGANVAVAYGF